MRVLSEREATPREIAEEIGEALNNVAYHIKVLKKLGCIELVQVSPAQGGRVTEHLYRGAQRPYFELEDMKQLNESEKVNVISAITQHISEDIAKAMAHGTFYDHDESHLSRMPMVLDPEGWNEVTELLDGTLHGLTAIQEKVNERAEAKTMLAKVAIIQFESPQPKKKKPKP